MKRPRNAAAVVAVLMLGLGLAVALAQETTPSVHQRSRLISESSLLTGLAARAVFPFIDTTPNPVRRAHIAITDATADCRPGAAPPANMQVLVGQAGVALVPVMTAATNTGISTTPGQCVFHVTIHPGSGGVPPKVTDIVVLNGGAAPLTGINTITVSADVR